MMLSNGDLSISKCLAIIDVRIDVLFYTVGNQHKEEQILDTLLGYVVITFTSVL